MKYAINEFFKLAKKRYDETAIDLRREETIQDDMHLFFFNQNVQTRARLNLLSVLRKIMANLICR